MKCISVVLSEVFRNNCSFLILPGNSDAQVGEEPKGKSKGM
jgi:hypothetical protein